MSSGTPTSSPSSSFEPNEFEIKYHVLLDGYNKLKLEYQELRVKYDQLLIQSSAINMNTSNGSVVNTTGSTGGNSNGNGGAESTSNAPDTTGNGAGAATTPSVQPAATGNGGGSASASTTPNQTPTLTSTTSSNDLSLSKHNILYTQTASTPLSIGVASSSMTIQSPPSPSLFGASAGSPSSKEANITVSLSSSKESLHSSNNAVPVGKEKKLGNLLNKIIHSGSSSKKEKVKREKGLTKSNASIDELEKPKSGFDYDSKVKELSSFYRHLPELGVIPSDKNVLSFFTGPDYVSNPTGELNTEVDRPMIKYPMGFADTVYACSTSTYPFPTGRPNREGDPIADRYTCVVYNNRLITVLADGCNWGEKPKQAAKHASEAFIEHVTSKLDDLTNVKEAGRILFEAFENAHKSIITGGSNGCEFWEIGTTTLLGGVLLEINKGQDKWSPQWEFVCASVGDCKAYLINSNEIIDITENNRANLDAKDCGGRLGPHLEAGKPDLRNLNIFCASAEPGDIILMVTDGVHDNLDPYHLGKSPNELDKEFNLSSERWTDVDLSKAMLAKAAFSTNFLENLLKDATLPSEMANRLLDHCWNITHSSRHFMETNDKRLPHDYTKYPGKMDHTTCIAFRVGHFKDNKEQIIINNNTNTNNGLLHGLNETPSKSIMSPHKDWIKVQPTGKKKISGEENCTNNSETNNNNNTTNSINSSNSTPDNSSPVLISNNNESTSPVSQNLNLY